MAKRLTEEDIRRIFREEVEHDKKSAEVSEEVLKVYKILQMGGPLPVKPGKRWDWDTTVRDIEWKLLFQKVIDTYWEVVEEDLND